MFQLTTCAVFFSVVTHVSSQEYELIQTYTPENFFDEFRFFTDQDPTGGFVQYLPYDAAATSGLISNASDSIYLGVDHANTYPIGGPGRPSVRLESKQTFTEGLFVLDLSHIPVGCGTWPAFWTVGLGDWPADGEIDIIENVNDATENNAALHAAGECAVSDAVDQTGTWKSTDCNIAHDTNQGCVSKFTELANYGEAFNQNGGGIYAMEWTSSAVNIWFFPPDLVPESLHSNSSYLLSSSHPDPSTFGTPSASFSGPCSSSFGEKFFNHTLIFDTTFCGGWAGGSYGSGNSQCPKVDGANPQDSCVSYVSNNPEAFTEAYWTLNSLRVWQKVPAFETIYYTNQTTNLSAPVATLSGNDVKVSPLTGGVLSSDDKKHFPILIDPGIGDGTFPETEQNISDTSPSIAWNTEETAEDFPPELSVTVSQPPLSEVGSMGVAEGVSQIFNSTIAADLPASKDIPTSDFWGALGEDAQNQLLALASILGTSAPSLPINPPPVPTDFISGTKDTSQEVSGLLGLLDSSTKSQLLSMLASSGPTTSETVRQEAGPADPSVVATSDPLSVDTFPAVPVLNIPNNPAVIPAPSTLPAPALVDTQDTSKAVTNLFSLLGDSTKSKLLNLLAPAAIQALQGDAAPLANALSSPVTLPADFNNTTMSALTTAPMADSASGASRQDGEDWDYPDHDEKVYPGSKFCSFHKENPTQVPVGSVEWVKKFIQDYFLFMQIFDSFSDAEKADFAALVAELAQSNLYLLRHKRDITHRKIIKDVLVNQALEKRQGKWNFHGTEYGFNKHGGGPDQLLDPPTHHTPSKAPGGRPTKPGVTKSYTSSSFKPSGFRPSRPRKSHNYPPWWWQPPYNGELPDSSEDLTTDDSPPDAPTAPGRPTGTSEADVDSEDKPATWDSVFDSLDPENAEKLRHFLSLWKIFKGKKPSPDNDMNPYVKYITGWQDGWESLDDATKASIIELLSNDTPLPKEGPVFGKRQGDPVTVLDLLPSPDVDPADDDNEDDDPPDVYLEILKNLEDVAFWIDDIIAEQLGGNEEVKIPAHADENADAVALGEAPEIMDENAFSDDEEDIGPAGDTISKVLGAIKSSPVELSEVYGPAAGEMAKDKLHGYDGP